MSFVEDTRFPIVPQSDPGGQITPPIVQVSASQCKPSSFKLYRIHVVFRFPQQIPLGVKVPSYAYQNVSVLFPSLVDCKGYC